MNAFGRVMFVAGAASALVGIALSAAGRSRPTMRGKAGDSDDPFSRPSRARPFSGRMATRSSAAPPERRPVWRFFALVFALSVPFWLAGAFISLEILPGLPVSSFSWAVPAAAAAILLEAEHGSGGIRELLGRAFDLERIRSKGWYLPMLLLMPAAAFLSWVALRLLGEPVPAPGFSALTALGLSAAFFVTGESEELGWSGYATAPLRARFGALGAALLLGAVTAAWHVVPLVQVRRAPEWIAWWALWSVAQRVLIVWLFENTGGSVFAAAVFHATANVSWQLFPVRGSYFDPRVNALILTFVAAAVVAVWGPRTLAGRRTGAVSPGA